MFPRGSYDEWDWEFGASSLSKPRLQIDGLVVTEPEMLGLRLLFLNGFARLGPHPPEAEIDGPPR